MFKVTFAFENGSEVAAFANAGDNLRFCFYENAKSFIFAGKYL